MSRAHSDCEVRIKRNHFNVSARKKFAKQNFAKKNGNKKNKKTLVRVSGAKKTKTADVKYAPSGGACAVSGELGAECGRGGRGGRTRALAPAAAQHRLTVTHRYETRHK